MSVEGGSGDTDGAGDLGGGVLPRVEHVAGDGKFRRRGDGGAAAVAAAGFRRREALAAALGVQVGQELIERAQQMKQQPPAGVVVSMPCCSTTRSIPRSARSVPIDTRSLTDRAIRDSRVITNSSPDRKYARQSSQPGDGLAGPTSRLGRSGHTRPPVMHPAAPGPAACGSTPAHIPLAPGAWRHARRVRRAGRGNPP